MANVHIPLKYNANRRDIVKFFHWTRQDAPIVITIPDGYYRVVTGHSEPGDMASWPSNEFVFQEVDEFNFRAHDYYCLIRKEEADVCFSNRV